MAEQLCQAGRLLTATRHGHRKQVAAFGDSLVQPAQNEDIRPKKCEWRGSREVGLRER